MRGKHEDSYSVRLPTGSPHVGSSRVRQMLSVLFAQRVPLVEDPGPGEEYLKLTLPTAQVHALQALAGGDAAGVALRRLVATFAGLSLPVAHPVLVLPPASPPSRREDDSHTAKPRARFSSDPPPWYTLGREQWSREGLEAKRYVLGMTPLAAASDVAEPLPAKASSSSSDWVAFLRLFVLYLVVPFGALFLLCSIFGNGGKTGTRPAVPAFPQWRPQ